MKLHALSAGALLLACVAVAPVPAVAQSDGIDPRAIQILKRSTEFVARQQKLRVDTRSTIEAVLTSGQKIQFDHAARVSVQRPDRFRAERVGDLVSQVFYFDGKALTLHNPDDRVFITVPAPGTIEQALDFARTRLDIVAPAGDLLYGNAYDILMTDVAQGFVVGKGVVEGVRCDHLAFRAPHVDWQIWIEEGARPLPRKLVITTRDVTNAPQFSVVATRWDLNPAFGPATFRFQPPAGTRTAEFLTLVR
jgi:hypothetical protein